MHNGTFFDNKKLALSQEFLIGCSNLQGWFNSSLGNFFYCIILHCMILKIPLNCIFNLCHMGCAVYFPPYPIMPQPSLWGYIAVRYIAGGKPSNPA